jgi:hypothetical protein
MTPERAQTTLHLLARDGAVAITFSTKLTAEQYDTLYAFVMDTHTRQELRERIAMAANDWGIPAIVDDG